MKLVQVQEVDDGDMKIFIDGEEVWYDHGHNLDNFLPNLIQLLGHKYEELSHTESY
jgi:hypothetical protein